MGNKLGRRREVVDEKFTRPQGLHLCRDMDPKKLRKLILDSKLAPCYPGDDECAVDLEECPICFLFYPSLNRSRCCMKGICTECFLQIKPPHSTSPTQCPFCKSSSYVVEYRGARSKEEKGMEQVEEQRVIEAKIRMSQQELQDEEERIQKMQATSSSSRIMSPEEIQYQNLSSSSLAVPSFNLATQDEEIISSQDSCAVPAIRQPSHSRANRHDGFDLDLEEMMVMEAIWLSIQEQGTNRNPICGGTTVSEPSILEDCYTSQAEVSPSGGLACAIATLAERQHMYGESGGGNAPDFDSSSESGGLPAGEERVLAESYPMEEGEWVVDHGLEVAEAGTSYASSEAGTVESGTTLSIPDGVSGNHFQPTMVGPVMPESFEEQMMLAMAVSLAEARARTSTQGLAWH